jgi:hypothetical protein
MAFQSIQFLLQRVQNRSALRQGLLTAQIIQEAQDWLICLLGEAKILEAHCLSFRGEVLLIECQNSAVAQLIRDRQELLFTYLKEKIPTLPSMRLQTRISPHTHFYAS